MNTSFTFYGLQYLDDFNKKIALPPNLKGLKMPHQDDPKKADSKFQLCIWTTSFPEVPSSRPGSKVFKS